MPSSSEEILSQLQTDYGTAQFWNNWVAQDWTYYDMVGFPTAAASANSFTFFSVAAGSNDPNLAVRKTLEQTNLVTPSQIGGAECFIATHLRMDIRLAPKARQTGTGVSSDTSFAARQLVFARWASQLSAAGVLVFSINQKQWQILDQPFRNYAPGWGLGPVTPPALGTGAGAAVNNGGNAYFALSPFDIDGGNIGDPFSFGQPVFLAPSTQFQLTLNSVSGNFPAASAIYGASADQPAVVWLMAALCGWKVRPRQ